MSLPAASPAAEVAPPDLAAEAWLLTDATTGEVLAERRADRRSAIASATKMMTAWVAMRSLSLSDVVRASDYEAAPVESVMGLVPGEFVSVRDLLYGLILASGNDAAYTLAEAAAGSVPAFVARMNRQAARLGLDRSRFANPIGLDQPGNFSTARDLAELGRRLMQMPVFRRIAGSRAAELGSLSPPREIESRNTLLYELPWADGIKTGHTSRAGYVLVGSGRQANVQLISVVLGTDSIAARDVESRRLLEYGMSLYRPRPAVRPGQVMATPEVLYGGDELPLRAARPVTARLREDQRLAIRVRAPSEVEGPIARGRRLGRALISVAGNRVASVPLVAGREVDAPTFFDRVVYSGWIYSALAILALFVILIVAALIRYRKRHPKGAEDESGMLNRVGNRPGRRGGMQ